MASIECINCAANTFTDTVGSTSCIQCTDGYISLEGATACYEEEASITYVVTVTSTFSDLTMSDWNNETEDLVADGIADALQVDKSRVDIVSIFEGSVIVESVVSGFESQDDAFEAVATGSEEFVFHDSLGAVTVVVEDSTWDVSFVDAATAFDSNWLVLGLILMLFFA